MKAKRHLIRLRSISLAAVVGITAIVAATSARLLAQAPTKAPAKAATSDKYVDVTGESYRSRQTPQGTISTISGNVIFRYEDSVLRTDSANYNQKTQIAVSPGKVQVDDPQNTIIGNQGIAYYKTRNAEVTGDVRMTVRPREQDKNAPEGSIRREFKDAATITCDKVIYNWRTRVANATGNLTLRQTDRTVTADRAIFEGRAEKVTLIGNVRGVNTKGEEVRAEKAVVILTEGAESLDLFNVKNIKIWVDPKETEDLPPAEAAPSEPTAPAPTAPAPASPAPAAPPAPAETPKP